MATNRCYMDMTTKDFLLAIFVAISEFLMVGASRLAADEFTVLPSVTDRGIDAFDKKHVYFGPKANRRDQLLVFLPGTHSRPIDPGLLAFVQCAADQGYHAVGLMYSNEVSAQTR